MLRYPPATERLGVVDIGSNSVRLVVYERVGASLQQIFNEKTLCALGAGVRENGVLNPDGVPEALIALKRFRRVIEAFGVSEPRVFATEAVRAAEDGAGFVEAVREQTGFEIEILAGADEARLAGRGVQAAMPGANGIVGDLGGGSLELVRIRNGKTGPLATLPVGPLYMQGLGSREDVKKRIDEHFASVDWLSELAGLDVFPVGGSWRSLARAHIAHSEYPLTIIHGYAVQAGVMRDFAGLVAGLGKSSVEQLESVSKRRRTTLPHGALVLERLLAATGAGRVMFSAYGAREGLVSEFRADPVLSGDPLIDLCRQIGAQHARVAPEVDALVEWMAPLFPEIDGERRRLHHAVFLLGDVAGRDHPDYRADHAFYRALRLPAVAIGHDDRAFIATALRARYGGGKSARKPPAPVARLFGAENDMRDAIRLGVAMRLAFAVSPGGRDMLGRTYLRRSDKKLELVFGDPGAGFDAETMRRRVRDVATEFDLDSAIVRG